MENKYNVYEFELPYVETLMESKTIYANFNYWLDYLSTREVEFFIIHEGKIIKITETVSRICNLELTTYPHHKVIVVGKLSVADIVEMIEKKLKVKLKTKML